MAVGAGTVTPAAKRAVAEVVAVLPATAGPRRGQPWPRSSRPCPRLPARGRAPRPKVLSFPAPLPRVVPLPAIPK